MVHNAVAKRPKPLEKFHPYHKAGHRAKRTVGRVSLADFKRVLVRPKKEGD